jgi:hypothetical protein
MKDKVGITGRIRLVLRDKNGKIKEDRESENLITTVGLGHISLRMDAETQGAMSHCGVGTGTTAASASDTDLQTAVVRVAHDSSVPSGATQVYITTFAAGVGTGALTEAGIFNASSSAQMLCHTIFSVINKGSSDSLVITWTITLS